MAKKRASVISLGCPKNSVLSNRLRQKLNSFDYDVFAEPEQSDLIIVNTCGFIEPAKEESIEIILEIARLKEENDCQIIATGCLVQRYKDELSKAIPEVDSFLDFKDIDDIDLLLGSMRNSSADNGINLDNYPWSYLLIADGCHRSCSFCAIPLIKGDYVSREPGELVDEAIKLVDTGVRELTLIGQDTSNYGHDLLPKTKLAALIRELSMIDRLQWIRLMYLQVDNIDKDLLDLIIENDKICDYIDLPLQHSSETILRSMRRSGTASDYLSIVEKLKSKRPQLALRTSVIVGYPGETEQDFKHLRSFIETLQPDYLGIFEYSAEEGTIAANLSGQLSGELIKERYNILRDVADQIGAAKKETFEGSTTEMLIERTVDDGVYEGRLVTQAPEIDGEATLRTKEKQSVGDIIKVNIESTTGYDVDVTIV